MEADNVATLSPEITWQMESLPIELDNVAKIRVSEVPPAFFRLPIRKLKRRHEFQNKTLTVKNSQVLPNASLHCFSFPGFPDGKWFSN